MKNQQSTRNGPANSSVKLLCLHGGPGLADSYFYPYLLPLAKDFELISYTQRGAPPFGMHSLLDELESVILEIPAESLFLIGHSFGGVLALEYLRKRKIPNLKGLILISWIYDNHWTNPEFVEAIRPFQKLFMQSSSAYKNKSEELSRIYFSEKNTLEGRIIFERLDFQQKIYLSLIRGYLESFDQKEVLNSLEVPLLSIAGEKDLLINPSYIQNGTKLAKNNIFVLVPEAKHFPFVDQPERVNEAILGFILKTLNS